jgi:hypothetical protein
MGIAAERVADGEPGVSFGIPIALDKVLFDSRFASSRAFGAAAERTGQAAVALRGDVTALWVHHLRPQWAAGGGAIAGMTTASSLFCLEQLAKDHWLRVVVRVEHRRSPHGVVAHLVTAAEPMMTRTCAALNDARGWPDRLMSTLSACVRSRDQPRFTRLVSRAEQGRSSAAEADLVSWVISA